MARDKWIQDAVPPSHKGRLHAALHVPEGKKITAGKLAKAEHSSNPHMRHMAQFAENMKGLHHENLHQERMEHEKRKYGR